MRGGITIGRISGINIVLDWSWIFILILVVWNLAFSFLPVVHPEWSFTTTLGVSALAALLFFASILAHELAHSLTALARGLPVRRITIFLFGGVSNIEREPPDPKTEFLVAIVGPATSLVLGVIFIFLGGMGLRDVSFQSGNLIRALRSLGPVQTILLWLGPINLLLGVFNLIPGFPLDGGRVLRSVLWFLTKNFVAATRWATLVGRAVAWAMILTGIAMIFGIQVPILGRGVLGGVWLAFIGWFLNNAAEQSYRQAVITDLLEGVPVTKLMRTDIPSVNSEMTVDQMIDQFVLGSDERSFPVIDNEKMVGLVCMSDIRKVPRSEWTTTKVANIMTPIPELDYVNPREDAAQALEKLNRRHVRQLPVIENGRMVGLLRRQDILRWLQLQSEVSRL